MPLVWRLSLTIAAALAVMLAGLGLTVYRLLERDLQRDFVNDLASVARVQARLALREDGVALTRVPEAALQDELGEPEAFLLRSDGSLVETLADSPAPKLSEAFLTRVRAGQTMTVIEGNRRMGWWEVFQPRMTVHTRVVAHPIYGFQAGRFEVAFLLVLRARDEGTVAALTRLRGLVWWWLLGGLLLSAVTGYALARVIAAPVARMARTAQAVQDGDMNARMPGTGRRDELGRLAWNLNGMLERLSALVTAQRRFTADAAHDLRTPIAVLRTEVELALKRERTPDEYRATLERLRGDLSGLSALSDDLLTLSRLEGEGVRHGGPHAPVTLPELLDVPLVTAQKIAAQRQRTLHAELPGGVYVQGDSALIARALLNLLVNALTHGGNTTLGVEAKANVLVFTVQDDGPGVPAQLRGERLFTRFARGEGSSGSGLGIAIAREVARVHGGTLTYAGPPTQPTTFTLTLPQAYVTEPA